MADVLSRQYADWFGLVGVSPDIDAGICWERLGIMPEYIAPCDMLMLIPTRLATELNGSGGLLRDVPTTVELYGRQYGVEWPAGHNVGCVRDGINTLTVHFASPWYPPAGEVIGRVSELFSCQVDPDPKSCSIQKQNSGMIEMPPGRILTVLTRQAEWVGECVSLEQNGVGAAVYLSQLFGMHE